MLRLKICKIKEHSALTQNILVLKKESFGKRQKLKFLVIFTDALSLFNFRCLIVKLTEGCFLGLFRPVNEFFHNPVTFESRSSQTLF